jgi:hypothetical protein
MESKPEIARGSSSARPHGTQPPPFAGYWFKVPSEIEALMQLSSAELKVYLVVSHAIQRDRNAGLLAISQVAKRAGLSDRHARKAIETLCQRRLLVRVNRATGAELTRKEEWNGRTVEYGNPIQWKQRDTGNLGPTGERSEPVDDRNASLNGFAKSQPTNSQHASAVDSNLAPVGERYLAPTGQRHLEYSECPDLNSAFPGSHHHQQKEISANALASLAVGTPLNHTEGQAAIKGVRPANPLSESRKADDDEKPARTAAAPVAPKTAFLLRVAQRHPQIDAPACFADVQRELRKAAIPLEAYLRRDSLSTTNPKALTNPRGYYRHLAKTMIAEHQQQMAGIPTETMVETPRCAKCNGSGYRLEQIEGQRPRLTGESCACKLGEELAAIERRAGKKAAAAVERKQPGQSQRQTLPTAGVCDDERPTHATEALGAARSAQTACP